MILAETMDDDHRKFEKELAKLNAILTIVTTGSSVIAGIGASLLILGITLLMPYQKLVTRIDFLPL